MSEKEKLNQDAQNQERKPEENQEQLQQPADQLVEQPSENEVSEKEQQKEFSGKDVNNHEDAIVEESASAVEKGGIRETEASLETEDISEPKKQSSSGTTETMADKLKSDGRNSSSEEKRDVDNDHEDSMVEEAEAGVENERSRNAQKELDDSMAEEGEDESANEKHGIPKKDYDSLSQQQLVQELEILIKNNKIQAIKEHVDEIKLSFNSKFDEELEEKKEEFLEEGGNIIDFQYSTTVKKDFNSLYFDYREKRNKYYQTLKQNLEENLSTRLQIIEDLKGLLDVEENINTTYKHFKELQDRWKAAGAIPRDKYNNVWNNYHHHVENFYDFLHLNREFRDMDFKHNLEQKLKIIGRAEELAQEEDTNKAFRELQMLHKMWKEDLGPVAKEYREDLWQRFSEATKKIHDKRQEYFQQLDAEKEKNLERKNEIIKKLKEISEIKDLSHQQWQQQIKKVEALRKEFFAAGKVPREVNEKVWDEFKKTVRQFNRNKNAYYKNLKKEQYDNLEKKLELVKIAEENKDSDDFKETAPLMKKIQNDWKKIGHVPRKDSDRVWKSFKSACNHFFDRLHAERKEENKEEVQSFENKKSLLEEVKNLELSGSHAEKLETIKSYITKWKELGAVPQKMRFIEGKYNKALDQLFNKLDVDKAEAEMLKYDNKIQALNDADDTRKINNEHFFLTKKVEEAKAEIRQLENNLQFFSNVDDNNPLVKEVHNNIAKHKEQLEIWKEKLKKIKTLY